MDEEIKEVGEMATIEDEEDITIEEDYAALEAETVIIDDDSNIQTDAEYEQAVGQKELADEAREALSAVLLSVLEKGEINDDDIAEIAAQQEIYTENVTALKILGLTTEDEKSTAGKSTTNVITSNIDYDELIKVLSEKADWLYTDEDGQVMLNGEVVPKIKVIELEAEKVKADVGEFKDLTTENFTAVNAKIDNLKVTDLTAVNAEIENLKANKADITNLNATNANIGNLTALVAEIQTLIGGNLTMDNIQSLVLTSDKVTIANALIKNAMIDTISANKINTGTINTNNVNIQSADGSMMISGTTQQFKDENNKVRIQIGKDAQGNFTFALFSQDGVGVLIDETGIKSGAVPDGLIVNDMVADGANISGSKLDINSVISSINNGTTTIKGTRIQLDEQGQSLEVAFNQLKTKVETIENVSIEGDLSSVIEQVTSNTTSINTMQGQISSLISNTTITKANGEVVQLKDEYNSTKDTVNSHTTKIGSLETNLNKVSTGQNKWLLEMFEKGEGIDAASPITVEHIIGKPLMKAVLVDDSATNNQSHFGDNYLGRATTHVYFDMDYNWETTATSDDGSTMYVNGVLVATLTSRNPTAITVPFKQGWNKITWVYNEGIGGDGWDFNPRLTTIPQIKYMNAYPMTNTDEVGNVLDSNIKTVSSKQATLEQNLDGFKQTVSNTYTTKVDFNGLQVGGTNLLLKTKDFDNLSSGQAKVSETYRGLTVRGTNSIPNTATCICEYSFTDFDYNDIFTFSFYAKGNLTNLCAFFYGDSGYVPAYLIENSVGVKANGEGDGYSDFGKITSDWKRYWVTWQIAGSGNKSITKRILLRTDGSKVGENIYICGCKFERGNKATEWTPAPQDIDSAITTVDNKFNNYSTTSQMNSAITQKANEITSSVSETYATKTSVTDVSNNLKNNYSTTSAMNSAINQKAESITQSVSNTYATKSEFNGLTIGGTNLYPNSNFKTEPTYTERTEGTSIIWGSVIDSNTVTTKYNGNLVQLYDEQGTSDNPKDVYITFDQTVTLQPNTTYTLSFDYYSIGAFAGTSSYIYLWRPEGDVSTRQIIQLAVVNNGKNITRLVKTFTTDSEHLIFQFRIGFHDAGPCWLAVDGVKLEKGNRTTSWSPAPEDIDNEFTNYSTTVQMNSAINQKANEITSTVSQTYATKSSVTDLSNNITNNYITTAAMNSAINQKANEITSSVSQTYATQSTTNSMLSQIQQNANSISTKVDVNGVISSINQSSETIAINANKINLNGYVSNDEANWSIDNEGNIRAENLNVEGDLSADSITCNTLNSAKYPGTLDGDIELFVNSSSGNDDTGLDDSVVYKTIQGALDALPKFLNGRTAHITMQTNSTEDVYLKGFVGGAVKIYLNGKTLYGTFRTYVCSAAVHVYGGTINNDEGATGIIHPSIGMSFGGRAVSVGFEACQYAALYNLKVYAPDTIPSGISSTDKVCIGSQAGTGNVYCKNVQIVNAVVGFRCNNHGSMHVNSSSGIASKYAFQSVTGGMMSLANNSQAGGKTGNTNKSSGGQIWYDANGPTFATGNQTTETGSAPVVSGTKTITIKSSYGDTYRSSVYNNWKKDGTVRQGDYGYGNCTGCWFFGTAFSELKGKTITKVQITIKRQTGGAYAPVEHKLWMHGHTGRPSGAPTLTSGWSQTFRLATGNSTTVAITNSTVLNAISAGTCKGFALRHTYDSVHYSVCSGSVTVKITYTE